MSKLPIPCLKQREGRLQTSFPTSVVTDRPAADCERRVPSGIERAGRARHPQLRVPAPGVASRSGQRSRKQFVVRMHVACISQVVVAPVSTLHK